MMDESTSKKQALRLRRFLFASATYLFGFLMLALCSAVGLFPIPSLWWVGLSFLAINLGFLAVFLGNLNLRFADPSLTLPQVLAGVVMVFLILILGAQVHFLALPYYSSLFVFAMLRLNARALIVMETVVLVSYCAAIVIRHQLFGQQVDTRVELINGAVVVLISIWYALAARYISDLRSRLRASLGAIEQLAIRDGLTNLWNRRHIESILASELERKTRLSGRLSVCMVDVDHFKSINDRFGHPVGDTVLRSVADTMQKQLRSIDQLGRFGGEEFLIVLPGATLEEAQGCAQRLLERVVQLAILPDVNLRVTVSAGVAEARSGESSDALLARVDKTLYQAKRDGRNRVAISMPNHPQGDYPKNSGLSVLGP